MDIPTGDVASVCVAASYVREGRIVGSVLQLSSFDSIEKPLRYSPFALTASLPPSAPLLRRSRHHPCTRRSPFAPRPPCAPRRSDVGCRCEKRIAQHPVELLRAVARRAAPRLHRHEDSESIMRGGKAEEKRGRPFGRRGKLAPFSLAFLPACPLPPPRRLPLLSRVPPRARRIRRGWLADAKASRRRYRREDRDRSEPRTSGRCDSRCRGTTSSIPMITAIVSTRDKQLRRDSGRRRRRVAIGSRRALGPSS